MQCREVVSDCLSAADHGESAVLHQKFRGAELTVVVEAHRVTVRTRIVDDDEIAHFYLRKFSVDREFIVVLTE